MSTLRGALEETRERFEAAFPDPETSDARWRAWSDAEKDWWMALFPNEQREGDADLPAARDRRRRALAALRASGADPCHVDAEGSRLDGTSRGWFG
jgi:hypothetical protein